MKFFLKLLCSFLAFQSLAHAQRELTVKSGRTSKTPWSSVHWYRYLGGIAYNYQNPSAFFYSPPLSELLRMTKNEIAALTPSQKLDIILGRYDYPITQHEWAESEDRADWEGHCDGVSLAQIFHSEPVYKEITTKEGLVVPLYPEDQKAILGFVYSNEKVSGIDVLERDFTLGFVGRRNDRRKPSNKGDSPLNFHLAIVDQIGFRKSMIVIDTDNGSRVLNQVAYAYDFVTKVRPDGMIEVTMNLHYADHPMKASLSNTGTLVNSLVYSYTLKLDSKMRLQSGEWLSGNKPDFIWFPEKLYVKRISEVLDVLDL